MCWIKQRAVNARLQYERPLWEVSPTQDVTVRDVSMGSLARCSSFANWRSDDARTSGILSTCRLVDVAPSFQVDKTAATQNQGRTSFDDLVRLEFTNRIKLVKQKHKLWYPIVHNCIGSFANASISTFACQFCPDRIKRIINQIINLRVEISSNRARLIFGWGWRIRKILANAHPTSLWEDLIDGSDLV